MYERWREFYESRFLGLILIAMSLAAGAAQPSDQTMRVARILSSNPEIAQKLGNNISTHLVNVEMKEVKPGVFDYKLVFIRSCECIPSTATVTVLEDLTPTYADGPIEYSWDIEIKTGFDTAK